MRSDGKRFIKSGKNNNLYYYIGEKQIFVLISMIKMSKDTKVLPPAHFVEIIMAKITKVKNSIFAADMLLVLKKN